MSPSKSSPGTPSIVIRVHRWEMSTIQVTCVVTASLLPSYAPVRTARVVKPSQISRYPALPVTEIVAMPSFFATERPEHVRRSSEIVQRSLSDSVHVSPVGGSSSVKLASSTGRVPVFVTVTVYPTGSPGSRDSGPESAIERFGSQVIVVVKRPPIPVDGEMRSTEAVNSPHANVAVVWTENVKVADAPGARVIDEHLLMPLPSGAHSPLPSAVRSHVPLMGDGINVLNDPLVSGASPLFVRVIV